MKWYIGLTFGVSSPVGGTRTMFRSEAEPKKETHGDRFAGTIGPFRTKRGAKFCKEFGANNPHCQCVADAERLAKSCTLV